MGEIENIFQKRVGEISKVKIETRLVNNETLTEKWLIDFLLGIIGQFDTSNQ